MKTIVSKKSASSMADTCKKSATLELPVSRNFYNGLISRVEEILLTLHGEVSPEYMRLTRRMINAYLNDNLHSIPESSIIPEVRIIFLTLKAEIDRARQRSLRAREAARRRAASKTEIAAETSNAEPTGIEPQPVLTTENKNTEKTSTDERHPRSFRSSMRWKPVKTGVGGKPNRRRAYHF